MLEDAFAALAHWAQDWQLSISVEKCCVMDLGPVEKSLTFSVDGIMLPVMSSCHGLDVTVSQDLSFSEHISSIVYKAHLRANAVHRCFESCSINLLLCAYIVYVRPLLKHNTVIWSPNLKYDIEAIEWVQRQFTKWIPGFGNDTYNERLSQLGIRTTLEL